MDHTTNQKFDSLNNKINTVELNFTNKLQETELTIVSAVTKIKADVSVELAKHLDSCDAILKDFINVNKDFIAIKEDFSSKYLKLKSDLNESQESYNLQLNLRDIFVLNSIASMDSKINKMHFDIIDNHDNIAVTYINPNGAVEYGAIKKVLPDNKTIKMDQDNKLYLNYTFDLNTFDISKNNNITVDGLSLSNGRYLSASKINNDLNNATFNIGSLTLKLDLLTQKVAAINMFVTSTNFKKSNPSQQELTNFILALLSTKDKLLKISDLSSGIKVKNTFDNHIWVFNKIVGSDGLIQSTWQDFGSDSICIANNSGAYGLITGSQEKFRGYVDIKGTLSINGLEEEFESILEALHTLLNNYLEFTIKFENKLADLEARISTLES